jgi:hypothetical protein
MAGIGSSFWLENKNYILYEVLCTRPWGFVSLINELQVKNDPFLLAEKTGR